MKLGIARMVDRNVGNKERLHIVVNAFADLEHFVVLDTVAVSATTISNKASHIYWFTSQRVKPGDNVVLYTGPGRNTSTQRADGGTDYFYYWGLADTIWNSPQSRAVLMEIDSWETSNPA